MGHRSQWKMIHSLNTCKKGKLSLDELNDMGINCYDDTVSELMDSQIIQVSDKEFSVHPVARRLINRFTLAMGFSQKKDIYIDLPSCFVIMPFSAPWSDAVYYHLILPAVSDCSLDCKRGDTIPRDSALVSNLVSAIFDHGLILIDISDFNPNVFYELGMVQTFGKEYRILIQSSMKNKIPADLQNIHYIEYDLNDLSSGKKKLESEINAWKMQRMVENTTKYVNKQQ